MMRELVISCFLWWSLPCDAQRSSDTTKQAFSALSDWLPSTAFQFNLINLPNATRGRLLPADPSDDQSTAYFKLYTDSVYRSASCATPYDPRMGITKTDYDRLKRLDSEVILKNLSISGTIRIVREEGILRVQTIKGYPYLDSFVIDFKNDIILLGGDSLRMMFIGTAEKGDQRKAFVLHWTHSKYYKSFNQQERSRSLHLSIYKNEKARIVIQIEEEDHAEGTYFPEQLNVRMLELTPETP